MLESCGLQRQTSIRAIACIPGLVCYQNGKQQRPRSTSMNYFLAGRKTLLAVPLGIFLIHLAQARAQAQPAAATNEIRILEAQGTVEISPPGPTAWILTQTNQVLRSNYRLRT